MVLPLIGALLMPNGLRAETQLAVCYVCDIAIETRLRAGEFLKTSGSVKDSRAKVNGTEMPLVWYSESAPGQFSPERGTTIENVISDMKAPSETLPVNPKFNWQRHPAITQHAPRGNAIARWWAGNRPAWCYTAISWFTVYEADNNRATNSRVEIKNLRMYFLSEKTRQWRRIDLSKSPRVELWAYPFDSISSRADERREVDGGKSVKPKYPLFHHGYGNAYVMESPEDIRAVYIAMDFRLVVENRNKEDDRNSASFVVNVGGDYYPGRDTTMTWSLGYAPGIGNGRYLRASKRWRTATMLVPNTDYGSSMEEIRDNPPPLNCPC